MDRARRRFPWCLLAILTVAVLARIPRLSATFWFDEVMYSRVYFDDPARRAWLLWKDVHPPLYALVLWLWSSLFGNREIVLRLPSLLAGLFSIVIVWKLAGRFFGKRVAVIAALLLALSPAHVWYSVESKTNMLALCLAVLAIWLFARTADMAPSWRRSLLAALVLAAVLATHSHAIIVAAALCVWLAWRVWRTRSQKRALFLTGAVVALWVPLFLWKVRSQGAHLDRNYLRALGPAELYRLLFVWFPHGNAIRTLPTGATFADLVHQGWGYWLVDAIAIAVFALGLISAIRLSRKNTDEKEPWPARLLLLWFVPALGAGALISLAVHHFYVERNLLVLLPAYVLLLALGIDRIRLDWQRAVATIVLVALFATGTVFMLLVRPNRTTVQGPKPDWQAAAPLLAAEGNRRGKLALLVTRPTLEVEYYLPSRAGGPQIKVANYCHLPLAPLHFANQWGNGSFWLVEDRTWTGCWDEAWQRARNTPGLVLGREMHFQNLVLHELMVK